MWMEVWIYYFSVWSATQERQVWPDKDPRFKHMDPVPTVGHVLFILPNCSWLLLETMLHWSRHVTWLFWSCRQVFEKFFATLSKIPACDLPKTWGGKYKLSCSLPFVIHRLSLGVLLQWCGLLCSETQPFNKRLNCIWTVKFLEL